MSIHKFLDDQIKQLKQAGSTETRRQRLDQLPSFTRSLTRAQQQADYLFTHISLIEELFQDKPLISRPEIQLYLQKPLRFLASPESVFAISQTDLTDFQTALGDCLEKLQTAAKPLEQQLEEIRTLHSKEIDGVRGLLKVPDLLPENSKQREIENTLIDMERVLTGTKTIITIFRSNKLNYSPRNGIKKLSEDWKTLYENFSKIRDQLSFDRLNQPPYSLSQASISVIQALVDGQQIALSQISPQTMNELHTNFKQFLNQVELRFKS